MQTSTIGLFVGLLLGLALAFDGLGAMVVVAFIGAIGFLVGKVLDGDLDVSQYVGALDRKVNELERRARR